MTEKKYEFNNNPWAEGITWFWYNDAEIFEYTQDDFDKKAKELAGRGITMVLTFSLTHFRLGFYPYWKEINECIRKIVVACHKYGIRVVEHSSAHLTHYLRTNLGWTRLLEDFESFGHGDADLNNWVKTLQFLTADLTIEGKNLESFVQIDGRTGEPARNEYGTYSMCFNNPDYREVYFNYMKDVVATGIDGIMNDDVQWFGERNACTCEHCRRLFREETGFELPAPDKWSEFFDNYENPAYVAWKKFKFRSTNRFYRDLTKHYESLGVKLLRPNYSSDILKHNPTCYSFDRCCDMWDYIFQENCFSAIIKQSYMDFQTEAVHRYAAGKRTGAPSMSMFYPNRRDSAYFGWALSRSWGQLYTGTFEGFDITQYEKPYRDFERENLRFYTKPEKLSDVSFYLSLKTRDFVSADAFPRYTSKMMSGIQAAYLSNLGVDMVFEDDSLEELKGHDAIVASHVVMMSDEELKKLSEYVKVGGRLIILGEFAEFDEERNPRDKETINKILGTELKDDTYVKLGDGEIFRSAFVSEVDEYQPTIWQARHSACEEGLEIIPSKKNIQRSGTGKVLSDFVKDAKIKIDCENADVIVTAFKAEGALAIHLMNLSDTIVEEMSPVSHDDVIENFTEEGKKVPEIKLSIKTDILAPSLVTLRTPERENTSLDFKTSDGRLEITVPGNFFSGYALVTVE